MNDGWPKPKPLTKTQQEGLRLVKCDWGTAMLCTTWPATAEPHLYCPRVKGNTLYSLWRRGLITTSAIVHKALRLRWSTHSLVLTETGDAALEEYLKELRK